MIEIIPNWHPIFVHFTVALLSVSVVLFVAIRFVSDEKLRHQWEVVAQWNLWLGAMLTLVTVTMGVVAYNTVAHDTPSHAAMTDHRNWAIATTLLFLGLAAWSALRARGGQGINTVILLGLVIAGGLLASTAWRGGEVVYRYGLGVMSLPKADDHGHADHAHGDGSSDHAGVHSESHPVVSEDGHDDKHEHEKIHQGDVIDCELPEAETSSGKMLADDMPAKTHDASDGHHDVKPDHDDGHDDHKH